jgi:protein Xni
LYRDYKSNHEPMPQALADALPDYREAFATIGVTSFELPRVEADDVIATLAVKVAEVGGQAVILSTDKIFLQLLSEHVFVRDHFKPADLDRAYIAERFGATPEAFVDFLALTGDSTNAIPGVPGIGPKTAAKLIDELGTLDAILAAASDADEGGPLTRKMRDKLQDHAADARLARSLVRLQTDLELGLNLKDLRYGG